MLQQHEPLQKYLSDIYPYVFVDELRDTSLLQLELLKSLVDLGSSVVFGVADEDQVLYEWRDARLETINEFENYFRAAPRFLVLNYRSPEPIVTVANTLIRNNPDRYEEELKSAVTDRPGAVYIHSDSDSEADFLAKSLVMAIEEDGRAPQEFALI